MPDEPTLLYLEPDDEITSVVRRVRDADARRVVVVAPGRSKATSSAVALRLLQRLVADGGREVAVVGDALTRSLAADAGLSAYASVADAVASRPLAEVTRQRAAIHVVRGDQAQPAAEARGQPEPREVSGASEDATAAMVAVAAPPARPRPATPERPRPPIRPPAVEEEPTQVVPIAPVPRPEPGAAARGRPHRALRRGRRGPIVALGVAIALLVAGGAAAAAVLPGATVVIVPATEAVGPVRYDDLLFDDPETAAGSVTAVQEGTASGTYHDLAPATGAATFRNFNIAPVEVPAGTQVAAGDVTFVTAAAVTAPPGELTPQGTIAGGEATAPIEAAVAGLTGNVPAEAIDTVVDTQTRNRLRGFPQNGARLVVNYEATGGGVDASGPVIEQVDVDAAVAALTEELTAAVAERLPDAEGSVSADAPESPEPTITGVDGLVGTRDQATFELQGELAYDRAAVREDEVVEGAVARLETDPAVIPDGQSIVPGSVEVVIESASRDGAALVVTVAVTGRRAAAIDEGVVVSRIAGLPVPLAEQELRELGDVRIETWPDWVDTIPRLDWRIDVVVEAASASASPASSTSVEAAP